MSAGHRTAIDWVLLLALVAMWGSSFMFNKIGIMTVPPATLVATRLALGAVTLLCSSSASSLASTASGCIALLSAVSFRSERSRRR